jgi:PKD repeat protein
MQYNFVQKIICIELNLCLAQITFIFLFQFSAQKINSQFIQRVKINLMLRRLICSTLIILFFGCSLVLNAQSRADLPGDDKISKVLNNQFKDYNVFQFDTRQLLDQRENDQLGFFTKLTIGNAYDWSLALEPNRIKADNYRLSIASDAGDIDGITNNGIYTFGGIVHGTDHEVRLTVMEDFLYGYVETGDDAVFIEPLNYFVDGAAKNLFVAYKASEIIKGAPLKCGVTEMQKRGKTIHQHNHSEKEGKHSRMPGNCFELEIAYANDFLMFQQFGSVAAVEAHVTGVLNNVQGNYDDEFSDEIQFLIVEIFVPTSAASDPFTSSTNSGTLLNDFTDWGPTGFSATHDLGALWSDRNFDGGTIGLAWVGVVCANFRYHILENFSTNANLLRVLHAHEMGHNFSFNHDSGGSNTIMAPSVNTATTWSTQSQNEFDAYIPNVDPPNGCLVFCPPPVPPVAIFSPNYNVVCPGSFVTLFDQSINSPTSWSWNIPGGIPSSSTEKSPTVQFNNVGTYTISLTATNANGSNTSNGVVTVLANGGTDIFFYEGFESGAGQFTVQNPDGSDTWTNVTVQGTREGSKAMYVNNFDYNAQGEEDALISPVLDFTGRTNTELGIEYAYTRYNNNNKDSLKVYVSTNGGGTYTTIFANTENGNGNFGTVPQSTSEFIPSQETDWCFGTTFGPGCLNLDLSAYDGQSNVVIKIVNKNDWGNNMYVDNIRMTSSCVVQNPPIALFTAAPTSGCFPIVVFFNDQSTNSPSSWNWSFPGGSPASSSLQNPTVVYSNPGTYSVTLTAINAAGSDTETISGMIVVEGPPVASFTAVNNNGTVSFTNNSTGSNLSYQWTFGDGNGSASANPTHTYADDGPYTVVLVVTSPCGTDVFEQTIFVESLPVAQFSALETDICAGEIVSFVDESTSNVISWDWSFPGGTPSSSSQENPQILYNTAGVFPVTLIVTSTLGNDTLVSNDFITVDPQPQAGFSSTISGFDVTLTNNSLDATSYNWSFGDGGTSTASDPTHTYTSDGAYTIELIASNSCGSDTITEEIVISSLPQGGFTSDVNIGCVPLTVNFLDISSANTTSWLWTFEGGTPATSSDQNPTVDYNSIGVFDVTLVATNANGSDTVSLADYVIVNDIPVSDFSFTITDQTITLTNQSTNADTYLWTFGDGNSDTSTDVVYDYAADGFYTLVLVASNNCGSDTLTQEIEIATLPEAGFTSDSQGACLPVEIQFTDSSSANTDSWLWTFEGGTPASSTDQNPLISYDAQGIYDVQLIVSNELGSDTLLFEDYIETFALPVPSFTASGSGLDIAFTNNSQFADTYFWDFGDTNSSTETDPSHTYGDIGAYSVTLYAINSCDTVSITELLNVNLGPQAIINSDLTEGCPDLTVAFDDGASPDVETWEWTFEGGNPSSSADQQPTVTYSTPGSYDVQLIVGNTDGTDTLLLEDYITVLGFPEAGFTTVVNNDELAFTNTSVNADTYEWQFGDGAISSETDPVYIYSSDGSYIVLLIAEGPCGIDSISQEVLIVTPPTADFTISADSICEGSSVLFTNNSSSNSTSFNWSFEGGTPSTSTAENPEVFYSAPGQYDVSLIVANAAGQDSVFMTDAITVNPNPVAQFSAALNVANLSTTNTSLNGLQYEWYFGDGGESNVFEPQYDYIADGTYEILLIVSNTCGIDSFTQEVEVVLPPTADFEANSTNGCAPYEIEFSNLSSDNTDTYSWLFEGGTPSTSTAENPVVVYNNEGIFDVQLIVSNAVGSDTLNFEDYITIGLGVGADFEASVNGTAVNFTNTSNNGLTYFWDFGDNQTSNEENPVHTYGSDGVYTVTLSVTNDCESVDIQQEVIISVGAPIALFEFDQESFCTGSDVEFFNLSSANTESYEWTFPGGQPSTSSEENPIVIYQNAGVYSATLIASNANGTGSYELVGEIIVYEAPIAGFDHTVSGFTVDFINNSQYGVSYSWDFGDGSDPSNIDTPSYLYSEMGTYTVSLTVMNPCDTSIVENTVVIDETAPSAFFTAEPTSGCAPLEVDFIDLSTDNVTDWFWQFEGGVPETSTETNPSVVYENIGEFNVTLTVSNAVGSDVIQFSNYIEIGKGPEALFSYQNGALGGIQFINNSSDASNYTWNFGDGNSSSVISPLHFYEEAGVYAVELIATNECGSDTMIIELEYTPVSIDEIGVLTALDIYPNPSTGIFEFNLTLKDQAERKLQVTLLDLLGRELEVKGYKVLNGTLNAGFDISDLPAGLYYLEFESEGEKTVERIIKI